jgi:hypothetical protein
MNKFCEGQSWCTCVHLCHLAVSQYLRIHARIESSWTRLSSASVRDKQSPFCPTCTQSPWINSHPKAWIQEIPCIIHPRLCASQLQLEAGAAPVAWLRWHLVCSAHFPGIDNRCHNTSRILLSVGGNIFTKFQSAWIWSYQTMLLLKGAWENVCEGMYINIIATALTHGHFRASCCKQLIKHSHHAKAGKLVWVPFRLPGSRG